MWGSSRFIRCHRVTSSYRVQTPGVMLSVSQALCSLPSGSRPCNLLSPDNLHRAIPDRRESRAISFAIACAPKRSSAIVRYVTTDFDFIGGPIQPLATISCNALRVRTLQLKTRTLVLAHSNNTW
jgi:hypothetical protein